MSPFAARLLLVLWPWQVGFASDLPAPRHFQEVIRRPQQPQVLQYRSVVYEVDVEHSRSMARKLQERGFAYAYRD